MSSHLTDQHLAQSRPSDNTTTALAIPIMLLALSSHLPLCDAASQPVSLPAGGGAALTVVGLLVCLPAMIRHKLSIQHYGVVVRMCAMGNSIEDVLSG